MIAALVVSGCSSDNASKSEGAGTSQASPSAAAAAQQNSTLIGEFDPASDARFASTAGSKVAGTGVVSDGRSGVLVFGPYLTLPAGKHRVEFYGTGKDLGDGYAAFEVASNKGKVALNASPFKSGPNGLVSVVEFTNDVDAADVETRVITNGKYDLTITKIVVR